MARSPRAWTAVVGLLASGLSVVPAAADEARRTALLPPEIHWDGASRKLMVPATDPWATPAERTSLQRTPSYAETVAWLQKLVAAAPELRLVSLGRSPEGRDIWMVIASRERAFTPEALRATGKPVLLAQAGIHAGEIDGKDAGLMLLRDITVRATRKDLLDRASLLFIPMLNVDGHERSSAFSRINQRGPAESGWRTNARNLNLNRDYTKLDAAETRAVVRAINAWSPDLYCDLHVTDGIDYQYDVTFGGHAFGASPAIGSWLDGTLGPAVSADLRAAGHTPGPLAVANPVDPLDLAKGIADFPPAARFSTGYGDYRHLPTVLVENHSLKPYPQRVLGTYVLLESTLRLLAREVASLRAAVAADQPRAGRPVPIAFAQDPTPGSIDFQGVAYTVEESRVTGGRKVVWSGRPTMTKLPLYRFAPSAHVTPPRAYWVPAAWTEVIERLTAHGVRMETLAEPREVEVTLHRLSAVKLAAAPFEGHVAVSLTATPERHRERYAAGSVRIPTAQPLGDLLSVLLEPASADSFLRWGFFNEVLQPTEYVEAYIMEPMAERILAEDAALRAEYEQRVREDAAFAGQPADRLQWIYERTPFYDPRALLYPVGREE
jgi:murein tripeptide amidase MpaA